MQELGKFNLKISAAQNELEKCMNFTTSNQLSFIDSFQCLSSSLDSLVKILDKDDFKYLSQEFDNNVSDLVKSDPYEYMSDSRRHKNAWPSKEKFYSFLTNRKISDKENENVLNIWNKSEKSDGIIMALSWLVFKM